MLIKPMIDDSTDGIELSEVSQELSSSIVDDVSSSLSSEWITTEFCTQYKGVKEIRGIHMIMQIQKQFTRALHCLDRGEEESSL